MTHVVHISNKKRGWTIFQVMGTLGGVFFVFMGCMMMINLLQDPDNNVASVIVVSGFFIMMGLWNKAFENLCRDLTYRHCESKEPGIYGIIAGGDFEAESLCLNNLWKELSDLLEDDLIICVPTKDIVYYTKADDEKLIRKMLKMAEEMFAENQKETPYLLFCKDVFVFNREEGKLEICKKYSYEY